MVTNLHYELTPKDLMVCTAPPVIQLLTILQSVFGQVGTLVREPLIRVRTIDCTQFT
jgi:hypothetical protein